MTPDSTVPSDTDRLAEPAPLTDEQVARFAELIDMHRQYGPALSIEGEAQLLVEVLRLRAENTDMRRRVSYAAAIVSGDAAEMLGDELRKARAENERLQGRLDTAEGQLAKVRENQLGLARGFLHDAAAQRQRSGGDWNDHTTTKAEGRTHGAITALQVLLVETGEVEYDEEADAVWDLVSRKDESAALGLGEGDGQ
jgi:hypothetical protein